MTDAHPEPHVFPTVSFSDPAELDIIGYRGDSGTFRVTVTQGGAPLDVSQATWDADVRLNPDAPVLATMTVTPVVGTTNAVDVFLPADQSALITDTAAVGTPTTDPGPVTTEVEAVWDLEMTQPGAAGLTTTLLRGKVIMTKDVSRPLPPTDKPPDARGVPTTPTTTTNVAGLGGPPPMLPNGEVLTRIGGPDRPAAGAPPVGPTSLPT